MQCVFLIEDDKRFDFQLREALKQVDSKLYVHSFSNLEALLEWIKIAFTEGMTAFETLSPELKGKKCELRLVVSKMEFLGAKHIRLIQRTRQFFGEKEFCKKDDLTAFVITAFESPDFQIHDFEDRSVQNVIFKPFDPLILIQDLSYAITGRHPLNKEMIHSMKTSAQVEMLKEAEVVAMSEIGFRTRNNFTIPISSVSKYYGEYFKSGSDISIYGVCTKCIPEEGHEGYFLCDFKYFSLTKGQSLQIRKQMPPPPVSREKPPKIEHYNIKNVVIVNNELGFATGIGDSLSDFHHSLHITETTSAAELMKLEHSKNLPDRVDVLYMALAKYDMNETFLAFVKGLTDSLTERNLKLGQSNVIPKIILLSDTFPKDSDRKQLATIIEDFFLYPVERGFLKIRLNESLEGLLSYQEQFTKPHWIPCKYTIKVANLVSIQQLSEAGLVMKYYRPIGIGSFRQFILWRAEERETPIIVGNCNFVEQDKADRKSHLCHFVFFGMSDALLKHIRLWIRENYVHEKQAKGA